MKTCGSKSVFYRLTRSFLPKYNIQPKHGKLCFFKFPDHTAGITTLSINKHPRKIFNFGNCYLGIFLYSHEYSESAIYLWCSIQLSERNMQITVNRYSCFISNNNYNDEIPQCFKQASSLPFVFRRVQFPKFIIDYNFLPTLAPTYLMVTKCRSSKKSRLP